MPARPRPRTRPELSLPAAELARLRDAASPARWARAWGGALVTGVIRRQPADFQVSERLPFEPGGGGEHLYLRVRKTGQNTRWVAARLAAQAGVPVAAVGYAGLKDRHAVTDQWFSLHLPGRVDPPPPAIDGVEVLAAVRHPHKLRTGMVAGNDFQLLLREVDGSLAALPERLQRLADTGVPNYFAEQRFGHAAGNLELLARPEAWRRRQDRSFGLSALRAALFNAYLHGRVADGSWRHLLPGEVGVRGDAQLPAGGLLWGDGASHSSGEARERELAWLADYPATTAGLAAAGVRMMRRPLGVRPENLRWTLDAGTLRLSFGLPRGAYATAVLRELGDFRTERQEEQDHAADD